MVVCRFNDGQAIALFALDKGCVAHPDDREQALCLHHAMNATPIGDMTLLLDLTHNAQFSKRWRGER